jgi:hypothetical protein
VKLLYARTRREVEIGAGKTACLKILIGVAIKWHGFPIAAEDWTEKRRERQVISDLGGSAKHALTDIVEGIRVVVSPQIRRIAKQDIDKLAAEFEARVWYVVAEIRLEDRQTRTAE